MSRWTPRQAATASGRAACRCETGPIRWWVVSTLISTNRLHYPQIRRNGCGYRDCHRNFGQNGAFIGRFALIGGLDWLFRIYLARAQSSHESMSVGPTNFRQQTALSNPFATFKPSHLRPRPGPAHGTAERHRPATPANGVWTGPTPTAHCPDGTDIGLFLR